MGADLAVAGRCPGCGAAVREGAPWCTLCYADLRPAPPPPPPPPPPPAPPQPEGPTPVLQSFLSPVATSPEPAVLPTWPCTRCGNPNALGSDACTACGAGFLAGLGDERPSLPLPGIGDLARIGKGQRYALAAGVVFVVLALTFLLGLL